MKRLFVAAEIPEFTRQALAGLQENMKGARWVPPCNIHLTLKFIGEADGPLARSIQDALSPIRVAPFFLPVAGVGAFPPKGRPKVIWAGLEKGHPHLFQLQKRVEDTLFALGVEPEKRAYHPHLTLGRCGDASPPTVYQYVKKHRGFAAAPFQVTGFGLFRSDLRPGGSVYTREAFWPFDEVNPL